MATRNTMNRLFYFTIEDEGMLAEAFSQIEKDAFAITYKVMGTEDVFVTTRETKEAMDRHDVPYNLLAEEEGHRISLYHSPLSKEELADYEDALRALDGVDDTAAARATVTRGEVGTSQMRNSSVPNTTRKKITDANANAASRYSRVVL